MSYSENIEINLKIEKIKKIIFNSCNGIGKYRLDFKHFNENAYRSIVAVCLNNVIKEKISIEEQICDGRSDIAIQLEKNKDFIIECKIWEHDDKKSVKKLQSAFNQLIRYSPLFTHNYFSIIIFNTFFNNNRKNDDYERNKEFNKISKSMIEKLKQISDEKNIIDIKEIDICSWLMFIKSPINKKETEIFVCFCDCPNKINKTTKKLKNPLPKKPKELD